jgi:hypothetical protein
MDAFRRKKLSSESDAVKATDAAFGDSDNEIDPLNTNETMMHISQSFHPTIN